MTGSATEPAAPTAPVAVGRLLRINVSGGGVPKRPVASAIVHRLGVGDDRHDELGVHGGPMRAVSLLAIEAIRRVAAEGHPLEPGGAGENLTTEGVELSLLPVGTIIEVGESVRLELTGAAMPCRTIRHNFREGRFGRLSILTHPSDSRMYARVLREGEIRPGDVIRVHAAPDDPDAVRERRLHALGDAESSSALEIWRAAADAGFDVRIAHDGDLAAAASPELPGGAFNKAYGLDWVPVLVPAAAEHFRAAGAVGWLEMREPPWPGAQAETAIDHFAAPPEAIPEAHAPPGVRIRRAEQHDGNDWEIALAADDRGGELPPHEAAAWRAVTAARTISAQSEVLVAEVDGVIVGTGLLHVRHGVAWLRAATVARAQRGRGVHRVLVSARVRAAVERGCDLVGASAVPGSQSARNLRALGFSHVARRSHYRVDSAEPRPG